MTTASEVAAELVCLVGTYLLHSTVLLTATWGLLTVMGRGRLASVRLRETLLRVALLAGLVTATLQQTLQVGPVSLQLRLPVADAATTSASRHLPEKDQTAQDLLLATLPSAASAPDLAASADKAADRPFPTTREPAASLLPSEQPTEEQPINELQPAVLHRPVRQTPARQPTLRDGSAATFAPAARTRSGAATQRLLVWLLLAHFPALAVVFLWRRRRAWNRLQKALHQHRQVVNPSLAEDLRRLADAAGMRAPSLTCVPRLPSPIAFGVRQPQICLPVEDLTRMSSAQLQGVLAHELAHHRRRDPLWQPWFSFLRTVLWFQPLNHWAVRSLRGLAEVDCDEAAARACGDGLPLAQALLQTAERLAAERLAPQHLLPVGQAMAIPGSRLTDRVQHLLQTVPGPRPRHSWLWPALLLTLPGGTFLVPGVELQTVPTAVSSVSQPTGTPQPDSHPSASRPATAPRVHVPSTNTLPKAAATDHTSARANGPESPTVKRGVHPRVEPGTYRELQRLGVTLSQLSVELRELQMLAKGHPRSREIVPMIARIRTMAAGLRQRQRELQIRALGYVVSQPTRVPVLRKPIEHQGGR